MAEVTPAFRIRSYGLEDYEGLLEVQRACFPPPYPEEQLWSRAQVESHARIFPAGALCVETPRGRIVASCTSLIIDPVRLTGHSWAEVSADGFITTHTPTGDTLYGIDIAVHPAYRRLGLSRLLYEARIALVGKLGLVRFQAAGRIPGYGAVADSLTPEAYVVDVVKGRREDPVLTPQLRGGLTVVEVLHGYISDEESCNCAVRLEWVNPRAASRDGGTVGAGEGAPKGEEAQS